MSAESVMITVTGEAKGGKTAFIEGLVGAANSDEAPVPFSNPLIDPATREALGDLDNRAFFDQVISISNGHTYRAATLYVFLQGFFKGEEKTTFEAADADGIREVLALDGINKVLQEDPNIEAQVSGTSYIPGAQSVCHSIIMDACLEAYRRDGGNNLVIVDGRNPTHRLGHYGLLGHSPKHIAPESVMPVFIDAPAEVAASRMDGSYVANLEAIEARRALDLNREDMPWFRPADTIPRLSSWLDQFADPSPQDTVASDYLLLNNQLVTKDHLKEVAAVMVAFAEQLAWDLGSHSRSAHRVSPSHPSLGLSAIYDSH